MTTFSSETKNYLHALPLLSRIARADQTAIQECVDFYGGMVWALAKQMTDSTAEAEKAVPEIFTDIWKNAASYNLEMSEEAVWIALIARRRLNRCYPQKNVQPNADFPKEIVTGKNDFQRIH